MTSFRIERFGLARSELARFSQSDPLHRDWPVVYTLNDTSEVYVGESLDGAGRLRQHLDGGKKSHLGEARVIVDPTFNKSACLDLEAYLIGLFSGEGRYQVLNVQASSGTGNYYQRETYRERFQEIFAKLRSEGLFTTSIDEIENSDLYKLSPFKSLTDDQGDAVVSITEGLLSALNGGPSGSMVIEGGPGTGKTVVAIFLTKLLRDIGAWDGEPLESESYLTGLFTIANRAVLSDLRIGLVVPQQSLRKSIQAVFSRTPGLDAGMVLSPFDVGKSELTWDLLIVDEAHRLNQRANQTSAQKNREFHEINVKLFGTDDRSNTQLDWITEMSHQQLFLIDRRQRVRPADLGVSTLKALADDAEARSRRHVLTSQLRVQSGDYVEYVRQILGPQPPSQRIDFGDYDVRLFDDVGEMLTNVRARNAEAGLARVVAGYAWPWESKKDRTRTDLAIGDVELRWNSRVVDWVDSPKSVDEVGSIHTIQGYDLNYAGVIIGRDLRYDEAAGELRFDREHYFDKKGMQNNPGQKLTQQELLDFVLNIYAVLLTRGIRGTYLYVVDDPLRSYLREYLG
ncbi:DUF2075 domain-containing protein [Nocardioides carbamazepini]|uniref:DNA/RNA helicase domain-containing protein n=1 Tax=Nocardioides carbamazepini TaxID=2854259 RepID=UPI00214A1B0F|nr:DNA/RNA helicase domain-containing protein [Nocardioides carbamazepini]MCR1786705.1 DUF2075 domain-containing protein [Nocardioides carbamazepini]